MDGVDVAGRDHDEALYMLLDGTRGLTANWDPGAFTIGNYNHAEKVSTFSVGDANFAQAMVFGAPVI